jgi:hypothetical protein
MFFSYRDYSAVYVNIFLNKQQIFTLLIFRIFFISFLFLLLCCFSIII